MIHSTLRSFATSLLMTVLPVVAILGGIGMLGGPTYGLLGLLGIWLLATGSYMVLVLVLAMLAQAVKATRVP